MSTQKDPIAINDLRKELKEILQDELSQLPETLKKLHSKDRVQIVVKLMPYVFPKVENVSPQKGEPLGWDWD